MLRDLPADGQFNVSIDAHVDDDWAVFDGTQSDIESLVARPVNTSSTRASYTDWRNGTGRAAGLMNTGGPAGWASAVTMLSPCHLAYRRLYPKCVLPPSPGRVPPEAHRLRVAAAIHLRAAAPHRLRGPRTLAPCGPG